MTREERNAVIAECAARASAFNEERWYRWRVITGDRRTQKQLIAAGILALQEPEPIRIQVEVVTTHAAGDAS